jgi:hypothetical protein
LLGVCDNFFRSNARAQLLVDNNIKEKKNRRGKKQKNRWKRKIEEEKNKRIGAC